MKKYKKSIEKTPLKEKSSNSTSKYIEPIHQIYTRTVLEEEFVYETKTKNNNIVNTEAEPDNVGIKKKTLKRKIKSIDKCKRELSKSQNISGSPKKTKRKIIKKKKKKKEIKIDNGSQSQKIENGSGVVTPNGNDEMDSFYLIDYQSKINKTNEGGNEQTPDGVEEFYHTFHESNFNQSSANENNNNNNETSNNINEQQNTNNDKQTPTPKPKEKKIENLKKSNHSISPNSTSKIFNSKSNKMDKKKEEISPIKIAFNGKDFDKEPNKQNKIKYKGKDKKSISLNVSKEKDIRNNENEKEKDKKHLLDIEFARKKKKILIKKKQNMKAILIQSIWRMYVVKKIFNYYRRILKFYSLMDSMIKKKLKTFLLFFFEQIKSLYDNYSVANSKKFRKKKIKLRSILPISNKNTITESNSYNNNNNNDKLSEDKTYFISPYNSNNNQVNNNNKIYNRKSFDSNEKCFSLKDSVSSMNDKINYKNCKKEKNIITIYKNKNEASPIHINKREGSNTAKIKYKYKQFRIEKINKNDNNNNINNVMNNTSKDEDHFSKSLSLDSKVQLSNKKRFAKSPVVPSSQQKGDVARIEKLFEMNYKNTPLIDNNKNREYNSVNDNNRNKRKTSYCKKIIGSNNLFFTSKNKQNKYVFSLIKFLIKTKEIISKSTKKKYFYKILNILKRKVLLTHIIDNYNNKKRNIMKNIINKYKIKTQVLKYLDKYKKKELIDKKKNKKAFYNESLNICDKKINNDDKLYREICVETNELTINGISHKKRKKINKFDNNKLKLIKKNSSLEINDSNLNKNKFIKDKNIIAFTINREIKFNKNKLIIEDKTSDININRKNYENKKFIIDNIISKFVINRSYKMEIDFNDKKLIISKIISNCKIINQNNERNKFVINKVVGNFNIKKNNDRHNFIITKIINHSPILNIKNNNKYLIITKKVNNLTIKGTIKKKINYIINKINNSCIIDDINAFREKNKKLYYLSLINNNKHNLKVSKNISNFNIKRKKKKILSIENIQLYIQSNKKNNFEINKAINHYISGNNLLRKYLYRYNENKLVITKISKNLSIKRQDTNTIKKQILYSTALLKIKTIISKKIQKKIYPKLINIMEKLSFFNLISKFINKVTKNTKLSLINNMQNKQLEEKYKNLYLNNKYNALIINKVLDYNITNENNNSEDDKIIKNNNRLNNREDNNDVFIKKYKRKNVGQIPKHYIVHKAKKISMDTDEKKDNVNNNGKNVETKKVMSNYEKIYLEKLYERKKNNFIKGNVISKIINLFIGDDKQKNNVVEIKRDRNSQGNVFKNNNKIYISRFKMSKTKNLKENNNINNISAECNDRRIRQYYNIKNSIKNSPIYQRKKLSLEENMNNKYKINIKEEKESKEKQIKEKIGVRANNKEKRINEIKKGHNRFKRRFGEESDEESEEEESEFEEEEEESEDIDKAKEILIKYILKKHKIMNQILLNAFNKWKKIKNSFHFIKKVNKNEIHVDIYENGGLNKSKKIFIVYRKFNNYSYYMKKILRKWKKITERKKSRTKHEESEDNEKSEFDEEEIEEVEDEEEETEEEIEKGEFRRRKHH